MSLLPDGVATVDDYYIRRRVRAGQHRFVRETHHVRNNVIAYHDPGHGSANFLPYGQVWHAANGRTITALCALGCVEWGHGQPPG